MESEGLNLKEGREVSSPSRAEHVKETRQAVQPGPEAVSVSRPAFLSLSVLWGWKCVQPPDF